MCGSTADIQTATAEIRAGKKKKEEEYIEGSVHKGSIVERFSIEPLCRR